MSESIRRIDALIQEARALSRSFQVREPGMKRGPKPRAPRLAAAIQGELPVQDRPVFDETTASDLAGRLRTLIKRRVYPWVPRAKANASFVLMPSRRAAA